MYIKKYFCFFKKKFLKFSQLSLLVLLLKEINDIIICGNSRPMKERAHAYGIVWIYFEGYYDLLELNLEG